MRIARALFDRRGEADLDSREFQQFKTESWEWLQVGRVLCGRVGECGCALGLAAGLARTARPLQPAALAVSARREGRQPL